MDKYNDLRIRYDKFIYEGFITKKEKDKILIIYDFNIPNLTHFYPTISLSKFKIDNFTKYIIFHIGLIELISYWKSTCSKNVIIKAGYLNEEQINWFKKLYYYGLGELFFTNNIETNYNDFMNITCVNNEKSVKYPSYHGKGNLIPIGGGKDSTVTLEILKSEIENNSAFIINPKETNVNCVKIAGYNKEKIITIKRIIDPKLIELNKKGFINGHTPFSAIVAFTSYLTAYINNKKYIVLSNESSANESNIKNTKINHQYSKTYEFETAFNEYTKKYFKINITYFSLLRPLNEYQISLLFSNYEKYHDVFKSCNIGSKENPWIWCGNCPKCLFVYIMLSPFLYKEKLINIFGKDLYKNKELLNTFIDLTGYGKNKPFECVGTYEEIKYALTQTIKKHKELPYLLKYYKNNYDLEENNLENLYNIENNLPKEFETLLKKELDKYVQKNNR